MTKKVKQKRVKPKKDEPKEPKKMGRPRAIIEPNKLKALMRMKPTLADTAAFFECDSSTIENTIRREYDCTFTEFRARHMMKCRNDLVREALSVALSTKSPFGKTDMLKFCLKNLNDWAEKVERIGGEEIGDLTIKLKWADEGDEDVDLGDAPTDPAAKKD